MYVTVAEMKDFLDIDSSTDDALISALISSAQSAINLHCHRVFEAQADTTRYFDAYFNVDGRVLMIDADLCAITSISIDGTTLAADQYTTNPRNETPYYEIIIKRGSTFAWTDDNAAGDYEPEDAIAVTGRWAYSTEADGSIEAATKLLTKYLYQGRDTSAADVVALAGSGVVTLNRGLTC
jgi:hypothetical protein